MTYHDIESYIKTSKSDSIKKKYAQYFLLKAKREKNTIKIADGFYHLSDMHTHTPLAVIYADSILSLNIDKKEASYPAKAYLQKGIQLYYLSKNSEALENYLKANEYYSISKNDYGQLCVKHYIGLLKNSIDEPKESLKIFRKNLLFFNDKEKQVKHQKQYLKSIFALADSYNRNGLLDSAEVINKRGLLESIQNKERYLYPFFLLSYGITKNYKEEYNLAIDSLLKGTRLLKNKTIAIADGNLFLYKAYKGNMQHATAIEYLKKNDSIYKKSPEIILQAKESYELLLKYYKDKNDNENYLKAIESLLAIDSKLKTNQGDLSQKIVHKYEIPLLLSEKERLISDLNEINFFNKKKVTALVILTLLLLFFTFYFYKKNITNKKRFDSLMNEYKEKEKDKEKSNGDEKEDIQLVKNTITTTGLPEELVQDILNKLEIFEKSNKFIKNKYTLNILAKELKTNSSYLSKVINSSKQVNFANYLNKLRVEYAIDKLKNNKSFRNYTVQAIAEDVGFNKAQSFSKSFQKQTGFSITYFIKQLQLSS